MREYRSGRAPNTSAYCWSTAASALRNGGNGADASRNATERATNSTASMPGRSDGQPSVMTVIAYPAPPGPEMKPVEPIRHAQHDDEKNPFFSATDQPDGRPALMPQCCDGVTWCM